ncbi:MAG: DUF4401 domain-containing protein [Burkholderiales bacterium]
MSTNAMAWEARLAAAGIALADVESTASAATPANPWYLRLMAGIGAFIGAIMVLLLLGLGLSSLRLFDSAQSAGAVGLFLCVSSIGMYAFWRGVAAEQFALAVSIAGQAGFAISVADLFRSGASISWWPLVGLQALLWLLIGNGLHRTLTGAALAVFGALSCRAPAALAAWWAALVLVAAAILAAEAWFAARGRGHAVGPAFFGLIAGVIAAQIPWFFKLWPGSPAAGPEALPWATQVPAMLLITWAATAGAPAATRVGALLLGFATASLGAWLPGWIPALVLALGGLAWARPGWAVVAALVLIFSVSVYYYSLAITLLDKAARMALAGVACIALAAVVQQVGARWPGPHSQREAQ